LPLVKYNAERIWQRLPEGVDLDDLISAGVFGLMDAIDAFDLGRGVKFETYCVPRIRAPCSTSCARWTGCRAWSARSTASWRRPARRSRPCTAAPTDAELAERLGLPHEEYEKMAMDANAVGLISLNKKWYETRQLQGCSRDRHPRGQEGEDPTDGLQRKDLMRMVTKGLNRNERLHHHPLLL